MMEHMIRQFLGSSIEGTLEEQDEEQLVDLLESQLEEEMAQVEEEGEAQRAQAQEQVCFRVPESKRALYNFIECCGL